MQVARSGCCRIVLLVWCDGFGLCVLRRLVSRALELLGAGLSPLALTSCSYKRVGQLWAPWHRLSLSWLFAGFGARARCFHANRCCRESPRRCALRALG